MALEMISPAGHGYGCTLTVDNGAPCFHCAQSGQQLRGNDVLALPCGCRQRPRSTVQPNANRGSCLGSLYTQDSARFTDSFRTKGKRAVHHHRIPADLPTRTRSATNGARETVELGANGAWRVELERLLQAARREFLVAEGEFLDRAGLEREMSKRRGGASAGTGC